MEAAFHRMQRRMVKQEELVVQIATESRFLKIELEDLRNAALKLAPVDDSLTSLLPADALKLNSSSLELPKNNLRINSVSLDSPKGRHDPSMHSMPSVGLPANIQTNSDKTNPPTYSSDAKEEGSQHKMMNKPTTKSSMGVQSDVVKSARMKLFRTGSRLSAKSQDTGGSAQKAPNMADGALGLRKKVKKKIFNAVMVPEQNATLIFAKRHPFRGKFRKVTEQPVFEIVFGSFVIASAILIGVETDIEAADEDHNGSWFLVAQSVCALAFITEIVVRLISYGSMFFGFGNGRVAKEWKWNMFDLLCLITTVADIFCELFIFDGYHELLTVFRQIRIIRAARVIRTMRFAREFRKMSYALQYSGSTLLWAIITLCCVMFFFATALTQATTEHLRGKKINELDETSRRIRDYYGTMAQSFHSLFQAVSNGKDWDELVRPLIRLGWILPAVFISYVAVTTFGVMNVVTSVFVESAVASCQHYKDLLIQENLSSMQVYIEHLREIFVQIDCDSSGEISLDELEIFLNDPSLQQYLESIDVHPDDARTLFRLLDKDTSGYINIDEFCNGCLRLKGEAKSFDIHCIIYENERMMHKFQEFINYLERGFLARIEKNVDKKILNLASRQTVIDHSAQQGLLESLPEVKPSIVPAPSFLPWSPPPRDNTTGEGPRVHRPRPDPVVTPSSDLPAVGHDSPALDSELEAST